MAVIKVKYANKCTVCSEVIAEGEKAEWTTGVKGIRHPGCSPTATPVLPMAKAHVEGAAHSKVSKLVAATASSNQFHKYGMPDAAPAVGNPSVPMQQFVASMSAEQIRLLIKALAAELAAREPKA